MRRRIIEHGGRRYLIASRRDLVEIADERGATQRLRHLVQEPGALARVRTLMEDVMGLTSLASDREVFSAAARALALGRLRLVRLDGHPRLLEEPRVEPLLPTPLDPATPPIPAPPAPTPTPAPSPPAPPPGDQSHWLAFEVVDQDGAPMLARYTSTVAGKTHEGELIGTSQRLDGLAADGPARLALVDLRYARTPRPGPPRPACQTADVVIEDGSQLAALELPLDRATTIAVELSKATVFTLGGYDLDHEIFVPQMLSFDAAKGEGISGIGCFAQILAYAKAHPERSVLVVGHTDTAGSRSHNLALSERRATQLRALLAADMEGWIGACTVDATGEDLSAYLRWACQRFGWTCDPTPSGKSGGPSKAALARWREHAAATFGIVVSVDAPASADDWKIAYGLLDLAVSEELDLDLAELAALRSGLRWAEPAVLGAGERWPVTAAGQDGLREATNRRTEVCFLVPAELPGGAGDPVGSTLHGPDARLWLDYIEPEPRAVLPISLGSTDGHPVPDTPLKVVSDEGRVRYARLDEHGRALLHDVAAGPFSIVYLDHDDIEAKVWAARFDAAVHTGDGDAALRVLMQPAPMLRAAAQDYAGRFASGDDQAFARHARALAQDAGRVEMVELLLHHGGWATEVEHVLRLPKGSA